VREGSPHILERITSGGIDVVFNTTVGAKAAVDSVSLRRASLMRGLAYFTTVAAADAASRAIARLAHEEVDVRSLQDRLAGR